jgi:hypothetical protein
MLIALLRTSRPSSAKFNRAVLHHIAVSHGRSTLAVSLPLAVVNGPRRKLARSYGVLSLIYVPTEANIPILEARSHFEIILSRPYGKPQ